MQQASPARTLQSAEAEPGWPAASRSPGRSERASSPSWGCRCRPRGTPRSASRGAPLAGAEMIVTRLLTRGPACRPGRDGRPGPLARPWLARGRVSAV